MSLSPPPPELTHLYTLHVRVGPALYQAPVPYGTRIVLPISGGNFSGPRGLKGDVLDLGADWVRPSVHRPQNSTDLLHLPSQIFPEGSFLIRTNPFGCCIV